MLRKNLEEYKENIFQDLGKKGAILTAGDKIHGCNSLTVSWGGLGLLWGKSVAFVFVRGSRYTYQFLEQSDSVTLSFFEDAYAEALKIIGTVSGKEVNKLELANLTYTYDPDYDGSYITQAKYCFKMKKIYALPIPYESLPLELQNQYYSKGDEHTMYICEIKQFLVKENEE